VKRYDYERPAAVALTELAPGNTFYAGGRKLTIDQVSVGLSPMENWHFCDQCSYIERHQTEAPVAEQCPRCESTNWNDVNLLKPMLRMRQVVTTVTDRDSRIRDDADERELHFFSSAGFRWPSRTRAAPEWYRPAGCARASSWADCSLPKNSTPTPLIAASRTISASTSFRCLNAQSWTYAAAITG
jgi:hypothetical protein